MDWLGLIGLPGEGTFGPTLPADLFSGSEEVFPELGHSGEPVALLAFTTSLPKLAPDLDWYAIDHQSGGYACDHPHFVGLRLAIRPLMMEKFRELARHYFGAWGGHFYRAKVTASDIVDYMERLAAFGVHCEQSYRLLQEGVYPIDATPEALAIVADSPPDLDRVQDACRYGGLTILILAENSD